jgi:NTE family protein
MKKKIRLVLSGGGTRYPCQVGGILRLAEEGYEIAEIAGTSCGAIVAAGLASGYQPNHESVEMVKQTLPGKNKLIDANLFNLFTKWGLIKGDRLKDMFSRHFVQTFKDCKIPVHIVTTELETGTARVFNSFTDPDMSLPLAVRASMAIPGVFTPVNINGLTYVDGGLTSNYMLDIFGSGEDVIGFKFGGVARPGQPLGKKNEIKTLAQYINANIETVLSSTENPYIEDALYARTITLKTKHKSLNFKITDADVEEMVKEGYDSVDKFLKKHKL